MLSTARCSIFAWLYIRTFVILSLLTIILIAIRHYASPIFPNLPASVYYFQQIKNATVTPTRYSTTFRYNARRSSTGFTTPGRPTVEDDQPAPNDQPSFFDSPKKNVTVIVTGCGDRRTEAMTLIKSIFISSWPSEKSHVKVYFFTEPKWHDLTRRGFNILAKSAAFRNKSISMQVVAPVFPNVGSEAVQNMWRTLWKPCATQRLFLQDVLPDEVAVIYLDSDVRLLAPIQLMWNLFREMNSSQIMAMSAEHEIESVAWYTENRQPAHVAPLGVNSGVLLMNLTRMRAANFTAKLLLHYEQHQKQLVFHDQDLLNIQFSEHPEQLAILPCSWNYRAHHCVEGISNCATAEQDGIMLIHGTADTLYKPGTQWRSLFPEINSAFEKYKPNKDLEKTFREPLRQKMLNVSDDKLCKELYFKGFDMEWSNKSFTEEPKVR